MIFEHQALALGPGTRAKPPSGGPQDEAALSASSIFNPPALPEVMTGMDGARFPVHHHRSFQVEGGIIIGLTPGE